MKLRYWMIVALLTAAASPASAADTTTIAPNPTAASQIWLDPALPGTPQAALLASYGYVREEHFLRGTADVYGYAADASVRVEQAEVPYVTRVLVLRPGSSNAFSGIVHLNPSHPFYGQGTWEQFASLALEKGDVFVGVMIGADSATRRMSAGATSHPTAASAVLKWFNPERYAGIEVTDDGLAYDIFADTARQIRNGSLMGGLRAKRVYAMGGSFTGSFLRTFINSGFHSRHRAPGGGPLIDGYLITVSSPDFMAGLNTLNSRQKVLPTDDPRRRLVPIDAPVIELLSENEALTNKPEQVPDKDSPPGAHRLYEMTGVTHSSGAADTILDRQLASRGTKRPAAPAQACSFPMTDVLMVDYVRSSLENLDLWVRKATAPPRVPRYQMEDGRPKKDENGNTLGGLRPPQLEVPLASYGAAPPDSGCDKVQMFTPMRRVPLSSERLKQLYPGGKQEYLQRFDAAVDRRVRERWLRAPDAARLKSEARAAAEVAFR